MQGVKGVPRVFWFGEEGGYHILIMEKLGQSLDYLYK